MCYNSTVKPLLVQNSPSVMLPFGYSCISYSWMVPLHPLFVGVFPPKLGAPCFPTFPAQWHSFLFVFRFFLLNNPSNHKMLYPKNNIVTLCDLRVLRGEILISMPIPPIILHQRCYPFIRDLSAFQVLSSLPSFTSFIPPTVKIGFVPFRFF